MSSTSKRRSVVKSNPTDIDKKSVWYLGSCKSKKLKSSTA